MTPITSSPPGLPLSFRALIGTHSAERMPRLWTLLPLLKRWSAIALLESTPSVFLITWLMIVREAWILGWTGAPEPFMEPFIDPLESPSTATGREPWPDTGAD